MLETDAISKTCPFMTKPVTQNMGGDPSYIQPDISLTWYQNCMATACMAWEPIMDGHGVPSVVEGYCKLIEKESNEPIY